MRGPCQREARFFLRILGLFIRICLRIRGPVRIRLPGFLCPAGCGQSLMLGGCLAGAYLKEYGIGSKFNEK